MKIALGTTDPKDVIVFPPTEQGLIATVDCSDTYTLSNYFHENSSAHH